MRIYMSVDMEGISCCERVEETIYGLAAWDTFRSVMAGDVNAAILGALEAGATEIVVGDCHATTCNLRASELHPAAVLKLGSNRRLPAFKGLSRRFDAAFLIGYHAKAGTRDAILSHTFIGTVQDIRVHGLSVGETACNAYLLAEYGIPVILVTGDDHTVHEAREALGDVETVAVKQGMGRQRGHHLPLGESHRRIREGARRAVERQQGRPVRPVQARVPVDVDVDLPAEPLSHMPDMFEQNARFLDEDDAPVLSDVELVATRQNVERTGPGTVTIRSEQFEDAYRRACGTCLPFLQRNSLALYEGAERQYSRPEVAELFGDSPLTYLQDGAT
jgi:D-amino peptidase